MSELQPDTSQKNPMNHQIEPKKNKFLPVLFILLLVLNVLLLTRVWNNPAANQFASPIFTQNTPTSNPGLIEGETNSGQSPQPTRPASFLPENMDQKGVILFSMVDGRYSHLFVFQPELLPLIRITNSNRDDIHPAINPTGTKIAFSSRRNGFWDIYILDLLSGETRQVTNTPQYDGSPSWSPDGQWLAYETYIEDNLEIIIQSIADPAESAIRLTYHPGADHSPSWSPEGRKIAFVSDRDGEQDIWLAYLDNSAERFINLTNNGASVETNPEWAPDGSRLAWAANTDGQSNIFLRDTANPESKIQKLGPGTDPVWNADASSILTELSLPNETLLGGYQINSNTILMQPLPLSGKINGLDWGFNAFPSNIKEFKFQPGARDAVKPVWSSQIDTNPPPPANRYGLSRIDDVTAPYPYLHDAVDESFNQLREYVAAQVGWDFLANLESAYQPLTEPPTLDFDQNWLYTGRAFSVNPLTLNAGWMLLAREDFEGRTYWRVYLKTRYQDGSQGIPLNFSPWNLNARYDGSTKSYEDGGKFDLVPAGYWFDFTETASRFGWKRLPALTNWRSYYPAARFSQFVLDEGLDWNTAMAQLYPPEALVTATYIPTCTPTPASSDAQATPTTTPFPFIPATPTVFPTPSVSPVP